MNRNLAFIFDLDNTLYPVNEPFKRACLEVFKDRIKNIDLDELFKIRNKYSNEVFEASSTGQMSMEDMYCYRIQKALEEFHLSISRKEALYFQEIYARCQNEISLSDEFKKHLQSYKDKGIKLGVISNGPSKHQWNKINNLKLLDYMDKESIIISGDIDVTKPHREIYDYALTSMNISNYETYYIGDNYEMDIVGASNAGLKTIWINLNNEDIKEIIPDYIVKNENELLDILDELVKGH